MHHIEIPVPFSKANPECTNFANGMRKDTPDDIQKRMAETIQYLRNEKVFKQEDFEHSPCTSCGETPCVCGNLK